jgi:hypothetical protein
MFLVVFSEYPVVRKRFILILTRFTYFCGIICLFARLRTSLRTFAKPILTRMRVKFDANLRQLDSGGGRVDNGAETVQVVSPKFKFSHPENQ